MTHQPPVSEDLFIIEASRSHSDAPQCVGLHWTSDCPSQRPLPDNTQYPDRHPCPWWDWNLQPQEARSHRPTPWTARPLGGGLLQFRLACCLDINETVGRRSLLECFFTLFFFLLTHCGVVKFVFCYVFW